MAITQVQTSLPEDVHSTSAGKDTEGKIDLSLLPLAAAESIARALAYGADKYGRNNYRKGHLNTDLVAAALRHLMRFNEGIDYDMESGLHHLDHALANLAMLVTQISDGTSKEGR